MKKSLQRIGAGAAAAATVLAVLAVAACTTPRAVAVDCDGNLRPINVPPAPAGALSRNVARAGTERGS